MRTARGWVVACCAGSLLSAVSAHAQENRVAVAARVVETYDSNQLRSGDQRVAGPKDNVSIAPGVTVDINRNFARQRVYLQGAAEYVFNSRNRFLNRESLNFTSGAQLRFGPRCQINPTAALFRAQSDLEDLGVIASNTVTVQDYSVTASCPRSAGFFPVVSGGFQRTDNARRVERNQSITEGRIGIVWRRPSLGEAELFGQIFEISRNRFLPLGTDTVQDVTDVKSIGVRLGRSVGTRIATEVLAAYTHADPAPSIRSFSGATYRGALTYEFAPRLGFTAGFGRALSGRGNLGTSYYIIDNAELRARAKLSVRTSAGAGVEVARRRFRGEDRLFLGTGRETDRLYTASANISYDLARPVVLNLAARYRQRDAVNDIYDYSSFATTLSASIRL
jgi:hypothetical protein